MTNSFLFRIHRAFLIAALTFSIIGCDQATKFAARESLRWIGSTSYLGNTFRLQYAENPGAFLSLGAKLNPVLRFWIFTIATALFLTGVAYFLLRRKWSMGQTIGFSLVLGGGIGNLIDRMFYGHVVDFLNFGIGSLRTGIFNIADIAITAGALILIFEPTIQRWFGRKPVAQNSKLEL